MISYGQNFEDVILARALSDVQVGSYVDVGAHDPEFCSVTNHFYQKGWSGINIEPQVSFYEKLLANRSRDINLNLCIGEYDGTTDFATVRNGTGLSTSAKDQIIRLKANPDWDVELEVKDQMTLTSVLSMYPLEEIHFLKIDVEANELKVVEGLDLKIHRPWIIVVEATIPGTMVPNYEQWEPLILRHEYVFVYSDGLNRFYLSKEHIDLSPKFTWPPNVFDEFEDSKVHLAIAERDNAIAERDNAIAERDRAKLSNQYLSNINSEISLELSNLNDHMASQEWELKQLLQDSVALKGRLIAFENSISWKLTKPFRIISQILRIR